MHGLPSSADLDLNEEINFADAKNLEGSPEKQTNLSQVALLRNAKSKGSKDLSRFNKFKKMELDEDRVEEMLKQAN
jgi:hypothetical protein